jgi:tetratricopeptide (TPR) repeat protein
MLLGLSLQAWAIDYRGIEELIHSKEVAKIEQAIQRLEAHLAKEPQDGEALWLTAKAYLYLADYTEDGKEELLETGKSHAEAAIEALPSSPHPYFWHASLMGRLGQTRGILSSLFMVKPMKEDLEQTIELDPHYADAHWVLSQLYHQAPGFPLSIGNKKLSLQHAEKAVELDSANLEYQLQLAVALEYNGRKEEAIQILEGLLANPALRQDPVLKAQVDEQYADFTK